MNNFAKKYRSPSKDDFKKLEYFFQKENAPK